MSRRPAACVLVLVLSALLGPGCRAAPSPAPISLRYSQGPRPFTCELELRDVPCVVCLKSRCCEQARTCDGTRDHCACAIGCLTSGNAKACAASCPPGADRAMADCEATACEAECPGKGGA